jgi:hypothetical protein
MTRTPQAASAARTSPSTTDSDDKAAAPAPAPAPADDGSDSDSSSSDGEIPLCDAPVVKKRKVETAATSNVTLIESERYKREDAGCAARLKKQEPELLPCRDPDEGEDDGGIGDRFQGYDGFTISGPPVFR